MDYGSPGGEGRAFKSNGTHRSPLPRPGPRARRRSTRAGHGRQWAAPRRHPSRAPNQTAEASRPALQRRPRRAGTRRARRDGRRGDAAHLEGVLPGAGGAAARRTAGALQLHFGAGRHPSGLGSSRHQDERPACLPPPACHRRARTQSSSASSRTRAAPRARWPRCAPRATTSSTPSRCCARRWRGRSRGARRTRSAARSRPSFRSPY